MKPDELEAQKKAIGEFYHYLKSVSESLVSVRPGPDSWSIKEVIGHLIDSACNNPQRFVRFQNAEVLEYTILNISYIVRMIPKC